MEINPHLSDNAKRDAELILTIRSGDEKAFAQLMKGYKDAIYFMLIRMVKNKEDAEELTLEAFEKAFTNIHQYESNIAFSTWLFCLASNHAIEHLRLKEDITISLVPSARNDRNAGITSQFYVKTNSKNLQEVYLKVCNPKLSQKSLFRV